MGGRKPAVAPSKVIDAIVHFKNRVIYTDVNGEISEYIINNLIIVNIQPINDVILIYLKFYVLFNNLIIFF